MMARIVRSDVGCWFYDQISARPPRLQREGRWVPVRLLVWRQVVGPVPENMAVVSDCSYINCVRPEHMRLAERQAA